MRILVYGFGPYRQFRRNITAQIVRALPRRPGLKKLVLPVRFQRALFVRALAEWKPDVVLGIGQSARRRIEIESRATNHRRADPSGSLRPIVRYAPKHLRTTLELKVGRLVRLSSDAGDYVCNYSMYIILREILRKKSRTKFGFIHIPHDYKRASAQRVIERVLRRCYGSSTAGKRQARRRAAATVG